MAMQRISLTMTQLRCLAQSDGSDGSEPYLWTTFFAFGAERLPGQTGNLGVVTPSYDAFRTEFPNGIKAGSTAAVPVFVATAGFNIDLDAVPQPKLIGAIAVLMEEDSTPQQSMVAGRIAYSKEIALQLEALADERIRSGDFAALTDAETDAIKAAIKSKVTDAVGRGQGLSGLFRNQDDNLAFAFKTFTHSASNAANTEIRQQSFDFPVMDNKSGDRFILSGTLAVSQVSRPTVDVCRSQRAALQAKKDEITGLTGRLIQLKQQLQGAPPAAKASIVQQITQTNTSIAAAQAGLPALQAALDACVGRFGAGGAHRPGAGSATSRMG